MATKPSTKLVVGTKETCVFRSINLIAIFSLIIFHQPFTIKCHWLLRYSCFKNTIQGPSKHSTSDKNTFNVVAYTGTNPKNDYYTRNNCNFQHSRPNPLQTKITRTASAYFVLPFNAEPRQKRIFVIFSGRVSACTKCERESSLF